MQKVVQTALTQARENEWEKHTTKTSMKDKYITQCVLGAAATLEGWDVDCQQLCTPSLIERKQGGSAMHSLLLQFLSWHTVGKGERWEGFWPTGLLKIQLKAVRGRSSNAKTLCQNGDKGRGAPGGIAG